MEQRQSSGSGKFWAGLATGILGSIAIGLILLLSAMKNPRVLLKAAQKYGLEQAVEKTAIKAASRTLQTIPKEYVALRQEVIGSTVRKLTDAYSDSKISDQDISRLTGKFYEAIADQNVSPEEIDQILKLVDEVAR